MIYKEILPHENLRGYVKCYYLSEYDTDVVVQDKAFATGCMEIMFNLGNGTFQTGRDNHFETTPRIELWGQIINPLDFRSLGRNKMLGIRFHPHTAAAILGDRIDAFNDRVSDFAAVAGAEARRLHEQLLNAPTLDQQIAHLEFFLLKRLAVVHAIQSRFQIVNSVIAEMANEDFTDDIQNVSFRHGISSRYLQKLFVEFTGLSPKLYYKINRFQRSLVLTNGVNQSLTSIAYQSGYFDQSHFIRDFKFFTGIAPSSFDVKNSSAILASPNRDKRK